jgi:hypothetical protein
MRRIRRASLVSVAALSTAAMTTMIAVTAASASDKSSANKHKQTDHKETLTVTSAKVCTLLTPAQGAALLGESGQTATPVAQSTTKGAGDCSWGTADGSNVDVDVSHSSSPGDPCSKGGQSVTMSGWKGCYYPSEPSFTAAKGLTYMDITFNVLPDAKLSKSTMQSDASQIFKGLGS